ncbi:MAG: hypothetical protein ACREQF_07965 [Candidatus Binataceae bacterium]
MRPLDMNDIPPFWQRVRFYLITFRISWMVAETERMRAEAKHIREERLLMKQRYRQRLEKIEREKLR